ncbi:MAG: metallophosphoesterase [Alistipes sp.]|nr:metallophosphoesterase [Alistipes sp.]
MVWLILLCSLILAAIDYRVARRVVGGQGGNALKRVVVPLWVLDFMPQILSCIFFLFFRDNPTWLMKFNCWAFLFYLMAAVARAPLGLAILISKSRLVRIAGGAVWAALVVVMAHGVVVTRTNYQINRVVIESDRVPESFSGYRILQLSDLHIGTMLNPEKQISELAELCNQEAADMITMCGDLVNIRYEELTPSITEALQKFEARDGIYSIIGNHDVGVYIKDSITFTPDNNTRQLILRQKSLGWNVLDNSSEKIYRGGDSIFVTSITYEKELQDHRHSRKLPEVDFAAAYKGVDSGCFTITLSHIPQLWDKILSESQADLTLAGHVHAMQIKLPIGGRGLSPSVLLYKRWSGLYEEQGRWLYINDGIGCVGFPMRIGARPEITIFELRHVELER